MKEFRYVHPSSAGEGRPSHHPDPIGTLLYLRANQLRILLLKPLFFSDSEVNPDPDMVTRALAIASDTIFVLHHLNANTDNYRRQHAIFRHFLASSCSLILLILTCQTHPDSAPSQRRAAIAQSVRQPLKSVVKLTSDYASSSAYSMKLHRKLMNILGILSRLNILSLSRQEVGQSARDSNTNIITQHKSQNNQMADVAVNNIYPSPDLTSAEMSQYPNPGPGMIDNADAGPATATPFNDPCDFDFSLSGGVWGELDRWLSVHDTFPALENGHTFLAFESENS